jgi:hypothetical protein
MVNDRRDGRRTAPAHGYGKEEEVAEESRTAVMTAIVTRPGDRPPGR